METYNDIASGKTPLENLPRIQVILAEGGHVFTLNNRRLWVLKKLREEGHLPGNKITVRTRPGRPKELERFTPERCSLKAKIVREKPKTKPGAKSAAGSTDDANGNSSQESDSGADEKSDGVEQVKEIAQQKVGAKDSKIKLASELDKEEVEAHAKRVEQLLDGVEMDDDL